MTLCLDEEVGKKRKIVDGLDYKTRKKWKRKKF